MVGYKLINSNNQKITNNGKKMSNRNLGYGLDFNGSSNYMEVQHNTAIDFDYTDDFSFSFFVKPTLFQSNLSDRGFGKFRDSSATPFNGYDIGFSCLDVLGEQRWYLYLVLFESGVARKGVRYFLPFSEVFDAVQHVVFVKSTTSSNNWQIWLNGDNLPVSVFLNDNITTSIKNTFNAIVNYQLTTTSYEPNIIYDIKAYNSVLSLSNIEQLYIYNNYTTNCVLHIPFNEIVGVTTPELINNIPTTLVGYTLGDKPFRDIQSTIVQQYTI
jgi:hypothetical protein